MGGVGALCNFALLFLAVSACCDTNLKCTSAVRSTVVFVDNLFYYGRAHEIASIAF